MLLPDLAVSIMDEENSMVSSSLSSIRGSKAMVIDFWHTKCTRCPAALDKLNTEAAEADDNEIIFISCALSQGDGNHEVASSLVCDGSLEHMTHVFMDMAVKELAKAAFGFAAVPFYVVVDKSGHVIGSGAPNAELKNLIAKAAASSAVEAVSTAEPEASPAAAATNTFTLDEDF